MTISADTLIGVIVTVLCIVVAWMFALHGRMSALERGSEERQEAIVQRFDAMTEEIRIIRQLLQHRGRVA
jgi:Tfp pilus assembly protein PilO